MVIQLYIGQTKFFNVVVAYDGFCLPQVYYRNLT